MPSPSALLALAFTLLVGCFTAPEPTVADASACDCSGIPRRFPAPCRCLTDGTVECEPDVTLPDTCSDECFCDLHRDAAPDVAPPDGRPCPDDGGCAACPVPCGDQQISLAGDLAVCLWFVDDPDGGLNVDHQIVCRQTH